MKTDKHHRLSRLAVAALGTFFLINVAVAAPWISAPSSDAAGDAVSVQGGGMPPGAPLELSLLDGQGQLIGTYMVDADPTGGFTFDVPLESPGGYMLEVREAGEPSSATPAAFTHLGR